MSLQSPLSFHSTGWLIGIDNTWQSSRAINQQGFWTPLKCTLVYRWLNSIQWFMMMVYLSGWGIGTWTNKAKHHARSRECQATKSSCRSFLWPCRKQGIWFWRMFSGDHELAGTSRFLYTICISTSSTAQGGGGSFKNRKPIGEIGCCESRMAERIH